jgi:hypothetical protein
MRGRSFSRSLAQGYSFKILRLLPLTIAREITKDDLGKTSITPDLQRKMDTAATACRP